MKKISQWRIMPVRLLFSMAYLNSFCQKNNNHIVLFIKTTVVGKVLQYNIF